MQVNQRDTLTPSDFHQKRSKSKSRESKLDSRKIRESIQSKQIDLDNFNDDISGLRLGALFKPYKDGRSNSSSQNFFSKSSKNLHKDKESRDPTVLTNQRKTVLKSEDY